MSLLIKMVTSMIHICVLSHLIYESWMTRISRPLQRTVLEIQRTRTRGHRQNDQWLTIQNQHPTCSITTNKAKWRCWWGTFQDMPLLLQAPWDLSVPKFWPWQISATLQEGTYLGVLPVKQLSTIQPPSQAMLNSPPGFVWESFTQKSQGFAYFFFQNYVLAHCLGQSQEEIWPPLLEVVYPP